MSYRLRVFFVFLSLSVLIASLAGVTIYVVVARLAFQSLQEKLVDTAIAASVMVDPQQLKEINSNEHPYYLQVQAYMDILRERNPKIQCVYILETTAKPGILRFLVDSSPEGLTSDFGEEYDAREIPEMLSAFGGPRADGEITPDEYGSWLSAYAPIDGRTILGVDMSATDVIAISSRITRNIILFSLLAALVLALFSYAISGKVTKPLEEIRLGTQKVAGGSLAPIHVKGDREFQEVAFSFNAMVGSIRELLYGAVVTLAQVIEAKDIYTAGHSSRTGKYAVAIAKELGLDVEMQNKILEAGLLHDIGKIGISDAVLQKTDKLSAEEFEYIKTHPVIGKRILENISAFSEILPGVYHHHERWDGKGYPGGLKGEDIPLMARILSVADAFEAMTSNRSYRIACPRDKAMAEIMRGSGTQFDPEVTAVMVELVERGVIDNFRISEQIPANMPDYHLA